MTATTFPHTCEATPESRDLVKLERMLDDPDYAGFRTEIQESINRLRAAAALEA